MLALSNCEYFTLMSNKEWLDNNEKKVAVYACGTIGFTPAGVYWKNNEKPVYLEDAASATSIYVYENDVYVSGQDNPQHTCYWINGHKKELLCIDKGVSNAISINGGTVFNVGADNQAVNSQACLWINEERFILKTPSGTTYSEAYSIFVEESGGGKYNIIIGGYFIDSLANYHSCYWTGGGSEIVDLGFININSSIKSIYLYKGKIYSVGSIGNSYYCWENDTIKYSGFDSSPNSIYVENGEIYITSNTRLYKNGTSLFIYGTMNLKDIMAFSGNIYAGDNYSSHPCYWINSSGPINFNLDGGTTSYLTSIFVKWDTH